MPLTNAASSILQKNQYWWRKLLWPASVCDCTVYPGIKFELHFGSPAGRLSELIEKRRQQHLQQMQSREDDMRQMFVNKVKDKEAELKQAEQDVSLMSSCYACSLVAEQTVYSYATRFTPHAH